MDYSCSKIQTSNHTNIKLLYMQIVVKKNKIQMSIAAKALKTPAGSCNESRSNLSKETPDHLRSFLEAG